MKKNIAIAVVFMIAGCFLFAEHTFAQYYDDQGRSVNSAGGNRYGDSRFGMNANPSSNAQADQDYNLDAHPDTYINDNPNFPSNVHSPSDGWNGQGQ